MNAHFHTGTCFFEGNRFQVHDNAGLMQQSNDCGDQRGPIPAGKDDVGRFRAIRQ